jgi:two-component system sensor kinase FixL
VIDTGPGVAPERMENLFTPFNSSKPDGLGIGLSICRTIVEAHGGRIWAENLPGGGAAFRFTLPRAQEVGAAAA